MKKNNQPITYIIALDCETTKIDHELVSDFATDDLERAYKDTDYQNVPNKDDLLTYLPNDDYRCSFTNNICLSLITAKDLMSNSDITSYIKHVNYRNWYDVSGFLQGIEDVCKREQCRAVIYIHNLSYEWSYIRAEFSKFFMQFVEPKDGVTAMVDGETKPFYFKFEFLEFKDSAKLFATSIKKLGDRVGYPKLGDEYDYDKIIYKDTKLTKADLEYCYRDCDIILYALNDLIRTNTEIIKKVEDIPLTFTGVTRAYNRYIGKKDPKSKAAYNSMTSRWTKLNRSFKDLSEKEKPTTEELDYMDILRGSFYGGMTHANWHHAAKVVYKVHSIDLTSSYPAAMIYGIYPDCAEPIKPITDDDKKAVYDYVETFKNRGIKWYARHLKYAYTYDHRHSGTFFVKLTDLRVKEYKCNYFPIMNLSADINHSTKIHGMVSQSGNCVVDNGRIMSADYVYINCNLVDLILFTMLYGYSDLEIIDGFTYVMTSSPTAWKNLIQYWLVKKSFYKQAEKDFTSIKDIKAYKNRFGSYSTEDLKELAAAEDPKKELAYLKQTAKQRLNAQYGINVQDLLLEAFELDTDTADLKATTFKNSASTERNYLAGTYVTSYSKIGLIAGYFAICIEGGQWIYTDTDSHKFTGDCKKVLSLSNAIIKRARKNRYNTVYDHKMVQDVFDEFDLGYYDYEGCYAAFCTMGNKKYLVLKNGVIEATIAGITDADKIYSLGLKTLKTFEKVVDQMFTVNVTFGRSLLEHTHQLLHLLGEQGQTMLYYNDFKMCDISCLSPKQRDQNYYAQLAARNGLSCSPRKINYDQKNNCISITKE